jgi:hypothetical protein
MADPHHVLFNQLFVDYIQSMFFKHPDISFTVERMKREIPSFYGDQEMVNSAFHLLLMKEVIKEDKSIAPSEFKVRPEAIRLYHEEIEMDRKIKEFTKKNLVAQYIPLRFWWAVAIGTLLLSTGGSFVVSYFMNKPTSPIIIKTESKP